MVGATIGVAQCMISKNLLVEYLTFDGLTGAKRC